MVHEVVGLTRRALHESSGRPALTAARASRALLLLLLLVAPTPRPGAAAPPSHAPSPAPTSKPAAPAKDTPAPASIPVPEVARQAEEVAKTLRDMDGLMSPGSAIENIERRLPDISARIAAQTEVTKRQLD